MVTITYLLWISSSGAISYYSMNLPVGADALLIATSGTSQRYFHYAMKLLLRRIASHTMHFHAPIILAALSFHIPYRTSSKDGSVSQQQQITASK